MDPNSDNVEPMYSEKLEEALISFTQRSKSRNMFFAPEIADKKLKNARSSMKIREDEEVLILLDNSIAGSAKDGICVTEDRLYWKETLETAGSARFDDIQSLEAISGKLIVNGRKVHTGLGSVKNELQLLADFLSDVLGLEKADRVDTREDIEDKTEVDSDQRLELALTKLRRSNLAPDRIFSDPDIPESKLLNARASMRIPKDEKILVLVDNSLTKSAKDGICVTGSRIYWKETLEKDTSVEFRDIQRFEVKLGIANHTIVINGQEIKLQSPSRSEVQLFADFLDDILGQEKQGFEGWEFKLDEGIVRVDSAKEVRSMILEGKIHGNTAVRKFASGKKNEPKDLLWKEWQEIAPKEEFQISVLYKPVRAYMKHSSDVGFGVCFLLFAIVGIIWAGIEYGFLTALSLFIGSIVAGISATLSPIVGMIVFFVVSLVLFAIIGALSDTEVTFMTLVYFICGIYLSALVVGKGLGGLIGIIVGISRRSAIPKVPR